MRGLIVAVQLLTRLPSPVLDRYDDRDIAAAAAWFPFVGLLVGGGISAALWGGGLVAPELGALAAIIIWVRITGGLHLDGLADSADGLAASHGKPERFLQVARDPNTGAFGVVAVVLVLLTKLVALSLIAQRAAFLELLAVALIPAFARWIVLVVAKWVPSLGPGRGATFAASVEWPAIFWNAAALGIAAALFAPMLICVVFFLGYALWFWTSRLGGVSGDCHGATIEVTEAALLIALIVQTRFGIAGLWSIF